MGGRYADNRILYSILLIATAGSMVVFWIRLPILYPHYYFGHQKSYDGYVVYSDLEIGEEFAEVIREVKLRMNSVEGYDPEDTYSLFVCHRRSCYQRFARQMGVSTFSQGLTIEPMGYVVINLQDIGIIDSIYRDTYPYTLVGGDTAHTIAHELAHLVTTGRLGILDSVLLPDWKQEGYAEYAASRYVRESNPEYSLRTRVRQYLDGHYLGASKGRSNYIEAGLVVEYLLDERRFGYRELMDGEIAYEEMHREMIEWGRAGMDPANSQN